MENWKNHAIGNRLVHVGNRLILEKSRVQLLSWLTDKSSNIKDGYISTQTCSEEKYESISYIYCATAA